MDEPTARRRRHANGAHTVSVADLLAQTTPDMRASVSAIQARAEAEATNGDQQLQLFQPVVPPRPAPPGLLTPLPSGSPPPPGPQPVNGVVRYYDAHDDYDDEDEPHLVGPPSEDDADPARHEDGTEEPASSNRLTRSIVVTLVAMVAAGVVTGVAALGSDQSQRLTPSVPRVLPASLDGPAVVRPQLVVAELSNRSTAEAPAAPLAAPDGPLAERKAAERYVMDFYGLLPRYPTEAYAFLGATMQGQGQAAFEADWRRASYVHRMILPSDDGAVRISVTISRPDEGEVIRLVQRVEVRSITVGGSSQLQIVGAQLLSAHRS